MLFFLPSKRGFNFAKIRGFKVTDYIDTNNGLGGDGPFTPERAGSCPAFALVEMCFSGKYTEAEVKKKLLGNGGAVAYFGTNDLGELLRRSHLGDKKCEVFMNAFSLNIAKYIASLATTVNGKVDVILLTGGAAYSKEICQAIENRVKFIAPVEVYAGENELNSLAENGYTILNSNPVIHRYDKNAIVSD
jgi:butyrate kinase